MIKKREFDDAAGREFEGLEDATIRPGVKSFLSGTFVGAVAGCTAAMAFRSLWFASDEPPIRVKGGSLHLDVLSSTIWWKPIGNDGKKWMLSGGTRRKDAYDVSIVTASTSCAKKAVTGDLVRVEYTDTDANVVRWVELRSNGNKTKVINASDPLCLTNSDTRLYFGGKGYISKIAVDGDPCHFASQTELDHALLMDF